MEQEINKTVAINKEVNIWVDIEKAEQDDKGNRFIYGRASDESLDMDDQKVSSTGIQKSLEYFKKFGKFDYDHKSKGDPSFFIGEPIEAEVKNKEFFVKGQLYKGIKTADTVWDLLKAGAKMGFSLTGKVLATKPEFDKSVGKDIDRITKVILTGVAVTPHPKNSNTYCMPWKDFAKSLSAGNDVEVTDKDIEDEINKSMDTSAASGKPLIGESLEKKVHKVTFGDKDESEEEKDKKKKKEEGKKMLENVKKSLESLESGVDELTKAIKRYDDEDEDKEIEAKGSDEDVEEKEDKEEEGTKKTKVKKETKKDKKEEEDEEESDEEDDEEESEECSKAVKPDIKKEDDEEEGEDKYEKKDMKDGDDEDAEEKEEKDDEDEEDCGKGKKMQKAFEVTPVLKYIGEQMSDYNDITKSLVDTNNKLTKAIQEQQDIIKSLGDRLDEIEDQPLPHKSVSRPVGKVAAGEEQTHELRKSVSASSVDELIQMKKDGKVTNGEIIKAELNIN